MARLPGPDLAGIAQHVVQGGNDRMPCFLGDPDRLLYLEALREMSMRYACSIHAYVLMTNHVHLLVTPDTAGAVSRMMQGIGRLYVAEFNARHRRTGTLWEGRKSLAASEASATSLPAIATSNRTPSTFRIHLVQSRGQCTRAPGPHASTTPGAYQSRGSCAAERQSAYRPLFDQVLSNDDINDIRAYMQQQRALGNDRFRAMVERKLGRCGSVRPAHRPPAPAKPIDKAL